MKPFYSPKEDKTLTEYQADRGKFGNDYNFRARSNLTIQGHKSGYHEAFVTTDTYNFLSKAMDNGDGSHTLPSTTSHFWKKHSGSQVSSERLRNILSIADGYRSDTAQTILSAPGAKVAGHSGSGLSQKNQAGAHDLLRKVVLDLLLDTRPISKEGLAAIADSIVIASMAPGEKARGIKGGTSRLKATNAKSEYESGRNTAKRKAAVAFKSLPMSEQKIVREKSEAFVQSTGDKKRKVSDNGATSPLRRTSKRRGEVSGGAYDSTLSWNSVDTKPPKKTEQRGLFTCEPFRAKRRKKTAPSS